MGEPYAAEELYDEGETRTYSREASALAFPLGGIGTGNVSLGVRGQLRDWELFNSPGKGTELPYAFFAIRCARADTDAEPVTRVLEAQRTPPHTEWTGHPPTTTAGLPRLDDVTFRGEYPVADLTFHDGDLPVRASLSAYTPFVPLDPEASGIPCAVLEYTVENPTPDPVEVSLVGSLPNAAGFLGREPFETNSVAHPAVGGNRNEIRHGDRLEGLYYTTERYGETARRYGEFALCLLDAGTGSDGLEATHTAAWPREDWWNAYQHVWDDFRADGRLDSDGASGPSPEGKSDVGSLAAATTLAPGEERTVRYLLTWYVPNREREWDGVFTSDDSSGDCSRADDRGCCGRSLAQNHYATRFEGAWDVAEHVAAEFDRLRGNTFAFREAFFDSTVPTHVLEAVSSQLSVARSTTCIWFADGAFYGYEGCADDRGCCEGTCTHVWNYAQSLARLFPSLEREMRRIDFEATAADGFMQFRTPMDGEIDRETPPAADGQMGTILRLYREWLYSGDDGFLRDQWPKAKAALEFAFEEWDPDEDGVMTEAQHNTYDIEFYGANTMTGSWYLGALRAGTELARAVGDEDAAARYEAIYERGREALDERCWNGEYYVQDLPDAADRDFQYGDGCLIDQVVGDWAATALDLGHVLPGERVRSALGTLFEHNFLADFSAHHNCNRTYALNDDAGLLMCRWPRGGRPDVSFPYCDEVMSGFAYQAAAHMISMGLVDEGLTVVKAIRERHDGVKRSPYNEFECGNHYARTMANWSVYEALCGYRFDLTDRDAAVNEHGFAVDPVLDRDPFRCFWITDDAWGVYERGDGEERIDIRYESD